MNPVDDLEQGRQSYREQAWSRAFESFVRADRRDSLGPNDLELLGRSAYMLGRDDEYVDALERAHQAHIQAGDVPRGVRCAFWIGHSFLFRGQTARATGWFARAQRLLDTVVDDCVERGYLMIPAWLAEMGRRNFEAGRDLTAQAASIGERLGDADLVWLARDEHARALLGLGQVDEALRLVDEALVAAVTRDLSPIVIGIIYCNTIVFCRAYYELRHVREWTEALTQWCESQPEMIAHNGLCLVHRAEILLMEGHWERALLEVRRSTEQFTSGVLNQIVQGAAFYWLGEALRLRGNFDEAEAAYRRASEFGREPQPGLALLRLSQNRHDAAAAAMRRVMTETTAPLARAGMLPAYVEIMLAMGTLDLARAASVELDEIAGTFGCEVLDAMAAHARGAVRLAEGRPADALADLRRALNTWNELVAVHQVARVRVRLGLACRALGDDDTARLEFDAARKTFEQLGAEPDRLWVDAQTQPARPSQTHGLTARELEVLRRIAAGKTNRDIAAELFISEYTVARHVQNIFAKLSVSSRAAATAFAFAHNLV